MNKTIYDKTGIEFGELPEILKEGKVFKSLSLVADNEHQQYVNKYKQRVYRIMDDILGDDAPKASRSYRSWFTEPERYVNDAFLKNERRNPKKWMLIVNAMTFALSEVISIAFDETSKELARQQQRHKMLKDALKVYQHINN